MTIKNKTKTKQNRNKTRFIRKKLTKNNKDTCQFGPKVDQNIPKWEKNRAPFSTFWLGEPLCT